MQHLSDQAVIAHALYMWANHVETGNVAMSANDAINTGKLPLALRDEQRQFVQRLRQLAVDQLDGGVRRDGKVVS